jgi:hypothetical protein
MFRQTLALLAASSALEAIHCDALVGLRGPQRALAGDNVPRTENADLVKAARERVKKWSKLGMWLPD